MHLSRLAATRLAPQDEAEGSITQHHHPVAPPVVRARRGDAVSRDALEQHVAAMAGQARPLPDGAIPILATIRDVLRRRAGNQCADALAETVVIETAAPRQIARVFIGGAGERRRIGQRRQLVLRAERIQVERLRRRGDTHAERGAMDGSDSKEEAHGRQHKSRARAALARPAFALARAAGRRAATLVVFDLRHDRSRRGLGHRARRHLRFGRTGGGGLRVGAAVGRRVLDGHAFRRGFLLRRGSGRWRLGGHDSGGDTIIELLVRRGLRLRRGDRGRRDRQHPDVKDDPGADDDRHREGCESQGHGRARHGGQRANGGMQRVCDGVNADGQQPHAQHHDPARQGQQSGGDDAGAAHDAPALALAHARQAAPDGLRHLLP